MTRCNRLLLLGVFGLLGYSNAGVAQTPAILSFEPRIGLTISGAAGAAYEIQFATNLSLTTDWCPLTIVTLPASSYVVPGTSKGAEGCRFYRAVVPVVQNQVALIPAGTFNLGSPDSELDRFDDEGPQMAVTISQSCRMGIHPVTQQEYESVTGNNPSFFTGDPSRPVDQVSWQDATNYCALLTQREARAGRIPAGSHYRLPTEAEWEYAARAGTSTRFFYGDDLVYTDLANHAWYGDNSDGQTQPVGQKPPNAWGLYDVAGNVWQWCQDWYGPYAGGNETDPPGAPTGAYRVLRGGSWARNQVFCRSACRIDDDPASNYYEYGFRIVLVSSGP
jgi:formylglycine-generating enzyme required for sulfatase activity